MFPHHFNFTQSWLLFIFLSFIHSTQHIMPISHYDFNLPIIHAHVLCFALLCCTVERESPSESSIRSMKRGVGFECERSAVEWIANSKSFWHSCLMWQQWESEHTVIVRNYLLRFLLQPHDSKQSAKTLFTLLI